MEARSTKQVHGSKRQKPVSKTKYPLCPEESLQVQHKFIQVHKNYHRKAQKTHMQVSTFPVTPGPKEIRPGPKNMYRSKKRRQGPKNIRPNVSAYENGVLPTLLWKQGPQSRCTGPKDRNRCQKQNTLSVQKNLFRSNTNSSRSTRIITARPRKHTCKSSTFLVTPGPKEIRPGPKNMYRSKKKGAKVHRHASPF